MKTLQMVGYGIWLALLLLCSCKGSKKISQPSHNDPAPNSTDIKKDVPSPAIAALSFDSIDVVKKAQILLYLSEYVPGKIDGEMKEQTVKALSAFQEKNDLLVGDRSMITIRKLGIDIMDFEIRDVQSALERKGYDPGPVDNLIGPMTRAAYMKFLQQHEFPNNGMTKTIKMALFSDDSQYRNQETTDPLFFADQDSTLVLPDVVKTVAIDEVKVSDVLEALKARGYDPGKISEKLGRPAKDALFRYQKDHQLPIGDIDIDTLTSLGFK